MGALQAKLSGNPAFSTTPVVPIAQGPGRHTTVVQDGDKKGAEAATKELVPPSLERLRKIVESCGPKITLGSFKVEATIGKGNFGRVRMVRFKNSADNAPFALKILPKVKIANEWGGSISHAARAVLFVEDWGILFAPFSPSSAILSAMTIPLEKTNRSQTKGNRNQSGVSELSSIPNIGTFWSKPVVYLP